MSLIGANNHTHQSSLIPPVYDKVDGTQGTKKKENYYKKWNANKNSKLNNIHSPMRQLGKHSRKRGQKTTSKMQCSVQT